MPAKTTTENETADAELVSFADETAGQAQRVVATYSVDAEECRMLFSMLGIETPAKVD